MFGFFFQRKRDEVRRLLSGRMNRQFFRQFRYGDRFSPRGSFCEVVWVIPYDEAGAEPLCELAFPAVTKDICPEGLSLIHNAPIDGERVLIGLESSSELNVLLCQHQHSTELGHGFHQIGLLPKEVVHLELATINALRRHFACFDGAGNTETAEALSASHS